ncbi:ABC transporter ATP-binding protein [halophilic archaeon]|nr:ABC transporter ATP-binding protein [halophilic archaeon]
MTLLEVENLAVTYEEQDSQLHSVNGISFSIEEGDNLAFLGESASGKSTIAKAILGLLPEKARIEADRVEFDGRDLRSLTAAERRDFLWEEVAFIPQTAVNALDPVMTVGSQIRQTIQTHREVTTESACRRTRELFETVGLAPDRVDDYPHEFSDGMRQRIVIAMALALDPKLIIADEPTTGLDVIVQDKIVDNILQIQEETDSSLLLITHDLGVIAETCDELAVFYGGRILERGALDSVLLNPTNPYTMGLTSAFFSEEGDELVSVPGSSPDLATTPTGCVFESRCPFSTDECETSVPALEKLPYRNQHTACHRVERAERMRREAASSGTWGRTAPISSSTDGEILLEVDELTKYYERSQSWLQYVPFDGLSLSFSGLRHNLREWYDQRAAGLRDALDTEDSLVRAVDGVSMTVRRGEILGIAGESGCGKSTLAQTLALLEDPTGGGFEFDGSSHEYYRDGNLKEFRRKFQIVFQDPYQSLNPRMRVEYLVGEPLTIHDYRSDERETAIAETLEQVGLTPPERFLDKYPNELSGGQRQRVAIARALAVDPDFLICDEPASMLDISLKAEILDLIRDLATSEDIGVVYISHDISSLTQIADRLAVMYLGRFVERGDADRVVADPKHPYTEALLSAVPATDPTASRERVILDEDPSDAEPSTTGCRFASRCSLSTDRCKMEEPDLDTWTGNDHQAACFAPGEDSFPDRDIPEFIDATTD